MTPPATHLRRALAVLGLLSQTAGAPDAGAEIDHGVFYVDVTREAGIDFHNTSGTADKRYILESQAAGVAFTDLDLDGYADLFFTGGAPDIDSGFEAGSSTAFYRNAADGTFADDTAASGLVRGGWNMGVAVGDFDNDSAPDLYLTRWGPNALYRNATSGDTARFAEVAGATLADTAWSIGAAFGDYDNDGDLDLYVANYVDFVPHGPPYFDRMCAHNGIPAACGPAGFPAQRDVLWRNDDGRFTDVSSSMGFNGPPYYAMGAVWAHLDADERIDLYVANDGHPNSLWRNRGGDFEDTALATGTAFSGSGQAQAGMGVGIGDLGNNGAYDLFVTNFAQDHNTLYANGGNGFFLDRSGPYGLAASSRPFMGWGTFFFDADHDGDLDLFVANGHLMPAIDRAGVGLSYRQRNQLYLDEGGRFADSGAGPGLSVAEVSRGAAYADYDHDGDLDIAVANLDAGQTLLRHDGRGLGHWGRFRLRGVESNRDAVGARLRLVCPDGDGGTRTLHRQVYGGGSLQAHSDPAVHFGLGAADRIDTLEVLWPSGLRQVLLDLPVDHSFVLVEGRDDLQPEYSTCAP